MRIFTNDQALDNFIPVLENFILLRIAFISKQYLQRRIDMRNKMAPTYANIFVPQCKKTFHYLIFYNPLYITVMHTIFFRIWLHGTDTSESIKK